MNPADASESPAGQEEPAEAAASYEQRLGRRLRAIRRQQGLSLEDVQARSDGEFKAGALGAYERGERSLSVPRLQRLAHFYGVPVDRVLPSDRGGLTESNHDWSRRVLAARLAAGQSDDRTGDQREPALVIDLPSLEQAKEPDVDRVRRYVTMVQAEREDYNGRMLSIRRGDVRVIGHLLGISADVTRHRLDGLGVLRHN